MAASVVLVTGVSRHLGARVAGALAAEATVDRVIGVDVAPPPLDRLALLGGGEFVRADIRNPSIARVISSVEVDTVVHLNLQATPQDAGGRSAMKETNVIGSMQLLAACQNSATVARLVVLSTTAVYGASPRDPALFTEDMDAPVPPRYGFAKDALEVEGYVRGFARRRPDVDVTVLRLADLVGPQIETTMTRYLALPVVPTVLGFDPRLQLCHEDDAVQALSRSVLAARPGVFNVAGDGVLLLSQALRRAGRPALPVPPPAVGALGRALGGAGADFSPEQLRFLHHGRVVDTAALTDAFGWRPDHSTAAALDDFVRTRVPALAAVTAAQAVAGRLCTQLSRLAGSLPGPAAAVGRGAGDG